MVKNLSANAGNTVWSIIQEDPTCHRATKPMHHDYWAHGLGLQAAATKPVCHNNWSLPVQEPTHCYYWAHVLQLLKPVCLEPVLCNKRSHCSEKPTHHSQEYPCPPQLEKACAKQHRPSTAQRKKGYGVSFNNKYSLSRLTVWT